MEGVTADTAQAANVHSPGKAPDAPWTAPLGTGRLFLLLFLTCGVYSLFYLYKTARDLRNHADRELTPWLYPLSTLIGLANAIAGARLAGVAERHASYTQRRGSAAPVLIGILIFVAHAVLTVGGNLTVQSVSVLGVLLFAVPWLLLERQLDVIKSSLPDTRFRTKPHRFTKLQWVTVGLGGVVWILIAITLWDDVVRWRGTALAPTVVYHDPQGRFSLMPERSGWLVVPPGTVTEEAALDLYGPGVTDWAVVHVVEQTGRDLDAMVELRYGEIRTVDENVRYAEKRELVPGTTTVLSHASYRGTDPIDGAFVFHVAAFANEHRSVEFISYSAGTDRAGSGTEALARSLRPGNATGADSEN
jgi:hypothetical protein